MMNKQMMNQVKINQNKALLKEALNSLCANGAKAYSWAYVAGVLQSQLELVASKSDADTLSVLSTLNYIKTKIGT